MPIAHTRDAATSTTTTATSSTATRPTGRSVLRGWRWACTRTGTSPTRRSASSATACRRRCSRRSEHRPIAATRPRSGPIEVEVVEPLRTLRLLVDAPEQGLRADLDLRRAARRPSRSRTSSCAPARARCSTTPGSPSSARGRAGSRSTASGSTSTRPRCWGRATARGASGPSASRRRPARPSAAAAVLLAVGAGQLPDRVDPLRRQRVRRRPPLARVRRDRARSATPSRSSSRTVDYRIEWRPGTRWASGSSTT